MLTEESFDKLGWRHVHQLEVPGRRAQRVGVENLQLLPATRRLIKKKYDDSLYLHQSAALKAALSGRNVCLTTSTASGKSLVFQAAALDYLEWESRARVIAIYPQKALGTEQEERWRQALSVAGLKGEVGRIDGTVYTKQRLAILRKSRVVVFTPDVLHAWLLSNLHDQMVVGFLKQVSLVVVDEVHTHSGVFGSNAAFLYRRLNHAFELVGATPSYIAASATIASPEQHLQQLFGRTFEVIGQDQDTSPRYPLKLHFVEPAQTKDFVSEVVRLLAHVAESTTLRFIAFADSRKQVEQLAAILNRPRKGQGDDTSADDRRVLSDSFDGMGVEDPDRLTRLPVLPYRAGYEEDDRKKIQERLNHGLLRGVISTSALELGIDVDGLNVCILIGVPKSATSLWQRIGRVGRHGPGIVVIINSGDIYDASVFADPASLLTRPPIESTLYLDNETIRYMHALCLARVDGEHDQLTRALSLAEAEFSTTTPWPDGFIELCQAERVGQISGLLRRIKEEGDESPQHNFPLRDIEPQFKVRVRERRGEPMLGHPLGSLSQGQLMREAYPGAVYYHLAQPYRVMRVDLRAREVQVRREKYYTTRPLWLPTQVFPDTQPGSLLQAQRTANLVAFECELMTRETVCGFQERRGSSAFDQSYPLSPDDGLYFSRPYFPRNLYTTGVILSHPALETSGVKPGEVAEYIFEAFLIIHPLDRQDVSYAVDTFEVNAEPLAGKGRVFLALYDQTNGSLRLSSRILQSGSLESVLRAAVGLAETQSSTDVAAVLRAMLADAQSEPSLLLTPEQDRTPATADRTRVILEGSHGIWIQTQEETRVERVIFTPKGVEYEIAPGSINEPRGKGYVDVPRYLAQSLGEAVENLPAPEEPRQASPTTVFVAVDELLEIPGVSETGWFDPNTGRLLSIETMVSDAVTSPVVSDRARSSVPTAVMSRADTELTPDTFASSGQTPLHRAPMPAGTDTATLAPAVEHQSAVALPTSPVPPRPVSRPARDWGGIRQRLWHVLHDQFAPVEIRRLTALLRAQGKTLPPEASVDTLLAMTSDGPDLEHLVRLAQTVFNERANGR